MTAAAAGLAAAAAATAAGPVMADAAAAAAPAAAAPAPAVQPVPRGAKVFVAGHQGLVGSAIWRALTAAGFTNLVGRTKEELDLTDEAAVDAFYAAERPEYVYVAAAKVMAAAVVMDGGAWMMSWWWWCSGGGCRERGGGAAAATRRCRRCRWDAARRGVGPRLVRAKRTGGAGVKDRGGAAPQQHTQSAHNNKQPLSTDPKHAHQHHTTTHNQPSYTHTIIAQPKGRRHPRQRRLPGRLPARQPAHPDGRHRGRAQARRQEAAVPGVVVHLPQARAAADDGGLPADGAARADERVVGGGRSGWWWPVSSEGGWWWFLRAAVCVASRRGSGEVNTLGKTTKTNQIQNHQHPKFKNSKKKVRRRQDRRHQGVPGAAAPARL